ncbi:hypothetical protein ASF19_19825 [Acidovorax sp. Leaf84]|uniref:hypothetical protein n=1 Tax=unclassified Acidovorax TaxID=2684926 RepID=UPI0006FF58B0|nr:MULTISPECIES: hypothetical protein [unclassified Acidovorax]KQO38495.1 hypothetical protein ASF19_19825 [Acidovorax sp. Leaf84]
MNARHNAIHRRTPQCAVAVRGAFDAHASSIGMVSKRLPSHQGAAAYLQGHSHMDSQMDSCMDGSSRTSQPQWLGNGFEDIAPSPGGGCNAGQ